VIGCAEARALAAERIDSGGPVEGLPALDAHLAGCAECAHAAEREQAVDAALARHLAPLEPSSALAARVRARVARERIPAGERRAGGGRPGWRSRLGWVGDALNAAGGLGLAAAVLAATVHSSPGAGLSVVAAAAGLLLAAYPPLLAALAGDPEEPPAVSTPPAP
jgi:anti-sigma factor RsiW